MPRPSERPDAPVVPVATSASRPVDRAADRSMSVLVDMAAGALDPAYAHAAARHAGPAQPATAGGARLWGSRGPALLTVALLLAGLTTGIAAGQVRQKAKTTGSLRASLVGEVRHETRLTDDLARQAAVLKAEVNRIQREALGDNAEGQATGRQLAALELVTGEVGVHGPGLVVTLNDAPATTGTTTSTRGGQVSDGRIYDRDLQDVVNALWSAGAEAMSLNGQRLTAQTAIRSAGEAVLVDFRPLSPPYVLEAVGDVDVMEPAFVDGPTARRFQTWTSLYGLGFGVHRASALHLAAAGPANLRLIRPGAAP